MQKACDQSLISAVMKLGNSQVSGNVITIVDSIKSPQAKVDLPGPAAGGRGKANVIVRADTSYTVSIDAQAAWPYIKMHEGMDMSAIGVDVNRLIAGVLSRSNIVPIDSAAIVTFFDEQLRSRQMYLPYRLSFHQQDSAGLKGRHSVAIQLPARDKSLMVAATFEGLNKLLLLRILWPILLSFLLVMLITGCIWLLWRIIIRQKKLEIMKNDFISNITHELKTPLAILGATNESLLAFGGVHDAEKTMRYLRLEQGELRKLQGLVDGIMALTKMEHGNDLAGPRETVSLRELVNTVTDRFSHLPGVQIIKDFQLKQELINTRPSALRSLLSNLLDNAVKYTNAPEKRIWITVYEYEQYCFIAVKDNGIGIEKAYLPFIFDKFYRVPHGNIHEVKGYGLGLSHAKGLVQKLDGRISVQSQRGEGTTFTVQIKKS